MNKQEYSPITPRTNNQVDYIQAIGLYPITIVAGCSGTGKTLLAFYKGYKMLRSGKIEKIVYIRSNTDFDGEKEIGALPGDLDEKLSHLSAPVYDNMNKFMAKKTDIDALFRSGKIELVPVAHVRGRSFENCLIILDEAQNTSPNGILAVITRMGEGSNLVIVGDVAQKDTNRYIGNGLADAIQRLDKFTDDHKYKEGIDVEKTDPEVAIIWMDPEDIQRHTILKKVVKAYYGYGYPKAS